MAASACIAAPFADGSPYLRAAAEALALLPDPAEPEAGEQLLRRHYGIEAGIATLSSEIERTAMATLANGKRLILKTSTRQTAFESFRFQSAVLAGLEGHAGVIAPEVIRTAQGSLLFDHEGTGGYLQTCIEGAALHTLERTPQLLHEIGAALARLNRAMATIDPPSARRPVLWNVDCWPGLAELQRFLSEGPVAACVAQAMADYSATVAPQLGELDWQVTHNDPSPFNMIATKRGVAFIDFGDGGWNPRIQDLAIAAGHFVSDAALPLGGAEHVIAGYASVLPLSELEIELLPGLMRARQSALILINHWRAHLFPNAAPYIMKNVHRAETGLALISRSEAAVAIASADHT